MASDASYSSELILVQESYIV